MAVVAVIPARGGSKGIPRKCIVPLAGRPLLAWTADAALSSQRLDQVLLSTDDDEIAEVGERLGLQVPFRRPIELAADDTPMAPVLAHALEWVEDQGTTVDAIVLLQPTSPLRRTEHIDTAVGRLLGSNAESVVTIVKVPHQFNPVSVLCRNDSGELRRFDPSGPLITRRQDKPIVYARNGPAVVAHRPAVVRRGRTYGDPLLGVEMAVHDSWDIDDVGDLRLVELLLSERLGVVGGNITRCVGNPFPVREGKGGAHIR